MKLKVGNDVSVQCNSGLISNNSSQCTPLSEEIISSVKDAMLIRTVH